jgi:tetratricopeptide (TPR) repeat protein
MGNKDSSFEKLFEKAVQFHNQGIEGDENAVQSAYDLLKKLTAMAPNNQVVKAYYGSAMSLLGRNESLDPMDRIQYALEGLKILDKAVSKDADNIEVRLLRGYVCYRLPEEYFGRNHTAVEDFNYLISRYKGNRSALTNELYLQLLYDLGYAYKNLGENDKARTTWQELLMYTNDKKYKDLLQNEGL